MLPLLPLLVFSLFSCGRKGPPQWIEHKPPSVVQELSAVRRADSIILSWSYKGEVKADSFIVQRSKEGGRFGEIKKIKAKHYTDDDVSSKSEYVYRVAARALAGGLRGEFSDPLSVGTSWETSAPADVSVEIGNESLIISWSGGARQRAYNAYKSYAVGDFQLSPANVGPLDKTIFSDHIEPDKTVYYSIRAAKGEYPILYEGPSSEIVIGSADFIPSAPSGLDAAVSRDKVLLYWQANPEPWVRGYHVYRSEAGGSLEALGTSGTPAFSDPDVLAGRRLYRVAALGPAVEGPLSEPLSLTVEDKNSH